MAGETRIATPLELALVEALSDAGCLVRSLKLAAKEAAGANQQVLAARLEAVATQFGGGAQDEIIAQLSDELGLTADRTWALQTDPDGAITRELMLARADARSMNVHLERAMGFGADREDRLDQQAEEQRIAAEITAKREAELTKSAADKAAEKAAEKTKVDALVAKAREEGAAKRAAAAAKLAAPHADAKPEAKADEKSEEKKLEDAPPAVQKVVNTLAKQVVAASKAAPEKAAPAKAASKPAPPTK